MFRHGNLSGNHSSFNKREHKHKKRSFFASEDIQDIENKTRIVEGYEPSHRAWMTFIQIRKEKSKYKCGGSIINNYWILSAGHCFCEQLKCEPTEKGSLKIDYNPQKHIRIISGLRDIDQLHQENKSKYQISEPVKIFIHPL